MEEKRIEEIKPKIMKRNAKEERIAKGKETRGKGDYPTMDDVLSDWDSERDGKKKNEDDDQKSRANTNLEDVDDIRKNEEKRKPAEDGDEEEEKKEDKGGERLNPSSTIISDKYVSIRRQDRAVIKFITSFGLQTGSLAESKLEAHCQES
ncbi:unnamed protein product [Wuchereria bancrofti]|uniref:Uncharacterized protein n=1 Tax=Wuchereria bancrofti TaxID=6293 RepID=A0A3P7DQP5_WUCBA|nr:unnamed protein product [Wuchereria bancrofti]